MAKTISYNRLWKLLIDKNMNRQALKEISGISTASIAKLGRGDNITTAVLLKICNALDVSADYLLRGKRDSLEVSELSLKISQLGKDDYELVERLVSRLKTK